MNPKFLIWLKAAGIAVCAYLCIFWVLAIKSDSNACWSWMMWIFAATYFILVKFGDKAGRGALLSAAAVGANLLPVLVIASSWSEGRMSAIFVISALLGTALAGVCHAKKSAAVFLLSVAVMILFNSFIVPAWFDHVFIN